MTWAAGADGQKILSPGGETGLDPWEPAGIGDEHQESQLQCPPCTWGAAGRRGAAQRARPLLDKDADGPAPDSQSPSARKPAPPAGLAASLHPGPRSRNLARAGRGVRTRGAPAARGTRVGAGPGSPLGGAAARCAQLRSAGALDTKPSTALPGRGEGLQGADAPKRGRAGAGSPAPHDVSPSPPAGSAGPVPPTPA